MTSRYFSVGVADGGWHGAYGWSNKPPPLARKMSSQLFKYRWASLASKEGALSKKWPHFPFSELIQRVTRRPSWLHAKSVSFILGQKNVFIGRGRDQNPTKNIVSLFIHILFFFFWYFVTVTLKVLRSNHDWRATLKERGICIDEMFETKLLPTKEA